jgi:hypothetical protein
MCKETILSYENNNGSLILSKKNNYYNIFFNTGASYYYCINGCGSRRCRCKDKDWSQGTWNGHLLGYINNIHLISNIFEFIKNNFDKLSIMKRDKLLDWFCENREKFIYLYYPEKISLLKDYVINCIDIGIFSKDFYENIKNDYFKKHEKILNCKINIEDLNSMFNTLGETNSLQNISFEVIENIYNTYERLSNENNFIFILDINNINNTDTEDILNFLRIFDNYDWLDISFNNIYDESIKENILNQINFDYIKKDFESIIYAWDFITDSEAFSI